jgi:tRNA (cmo5U34)-methyltransferase
MKYWDRKEKLFKYVDGVRQFFPLASEQLDTIARLIDKFNPNIKSFLDLGCGDGFLGYFIYQLYPDINGVFMDISEEMIKKAQIKDSEHNSEFIVQNFGENNWFESISKLKKFDLIISGYSIHHIENSEKQRLYNDIFGLLNHSGIFLNLEHVSSPTEKLEEMFNELFLENMSEYQKHIGEEKTKEEIKKIYYDSSHKILNKLESVEVQCNWLRKIGFVNVDCYMKMFELALFGGTKK